jgi:tetratricopeptide (TPR) repeat protein
MDCRKGLCVALYFVCGLAGCNLTKPTPVTSVSQPLVPGQIVDVKLRKESEQPKRTPPASLCYTWGDFAASEATNPDLKPGEAAEKRDAARKAYQQAISIDPKCLPAYQGLARMYVGMKDYRRATATYLEAQRQFPKEASLFYELGMCYAQQKDWEKSIKNHGKAADMEPEKRLYNNMLGYTLARAGRYDDSLRVFERLESEQEAHYRLAWVLKHLNETELAKQQLLMALQKDPDMKDARNLLAELDGNVTPQTIQQTNYSEEPPH